MSEKKEGYRGFRPLADMASGVLDPVLRKRAGINLALLQSWEDIIGSALGAQSRPLKILWPRRAHEDDPFQPATLVIACEGFAAIRIQHETGEIISRVNAFLGFAAIGRIKIEQKPVPKPAPPRRMQQAVVDAASEKHIEAVTAEIEDDGLRAALARLGRSVIAEKAKRGS
ncbi:DUF721 domain-containing protein [Phyllobacterium salinisoli]|uniref:DUF721 domain-containing protein n=1 Tax=Phyllobacterium salinisoli TaxID=1899321 RepID=A0A368K4E7_9HYPH|nr:DUF721 domain-containing protein [Phyllobacterium salinisoli]RCS23353.1 DUF721 domain-containing protein [Phyllobacterium salinisoli]